MTFLNHFVLYFQKPLRKTALSVLINVCQNPKARNVLQGEIHLVEFQKLIPIDDYGVLVSNLKTILEDLGCNSVLSFFIYIGLHNEFNFK